jgi:hypothetical protein
MDIKVYPGTYMGVELVYDVVNILGILPTKLMLLTTGLP